MANKDVLQQWVKDAVSAHGGSASVVQTARHIWQTHEMDLRQSGDLFFTWQYDMRWAAQKLRDSGWLVPAVRGQVANWTQRTTPR